MKIEGRYRANISKPISLAKESIKGGAILHFKQYSRIERNKRNSVHKSPSCCTDPEEETPKRERGRPKED